MHLIPLVLLLSGVGIVSVVLDRRLRAKKQRADTVLEEETSETDTTVSNGIGPLWATPVSWYYTLVNKQPEDFPQRFREWAVNASDDAAVKDWLRALSDDGLKAYTKHLSRFCADMGFELSWLVDKQIERHDANLAQTAQRIVLDYCQACQQAATCQDDLEIHKQLLSLEEHPSTRKNRLFGEKLLAKMVEANLATTSTAEFIAASAKERQQLIADAINEASRRDQATFIRLVKDVLYHPHAGAPSTGASAGGTSTSSASGTQATNPMSG